MIRELLESMTIDEATDYVNGMIAEIDALRRENGLLKERNELILNVHNKIIKAYCELYEAFEYKRKKKTERTFHNINIMNLGTDKSLDKYVDEANGTDKKHDDSVDALSYVIDKAHLIKEEKTNEQK